MLRHIHIRDYAIVDEVDLELDAGMTSLTGETGAGKSILLDALGLCLGDRADTGAIPPQADRAEILVSFDIKDNEGARNWLTDQALDADDECLLRRVIQRNGRSRTWINGRLAPLQLVGELGNHLVDIHGQHDHHSLMRSDAQRETLDAYGRHAELLAPVRAAAAELRVIRDELEQLEGNQGDYDQRLDLLRYQVEELEALGLSREDIEALDAEQRRLASAGDTIATCERAMAALYDDEQSVQSVLGGVARELSERTALSEDLASAHELFSEALLQVQEGCNGLRRFVDGLEVDPARLQWVEETLGTLSDLARKHRVRPEELPERLASLSAELETLASAETRLTELRERLVSTHARYVDLTAALSDARRETGEALASRVSGLMAELGMPGGELSVDVQHDPHGRATRHGLDQITFMVRTNPDQRPGPLARVASGGELSRIGLALEVATADVTHVPTLIFDEADTGIGGAVAEVVGRKLRELGERHQVLCVTHLAQVAAQGHHQIKVAKKHSDERTRTSLAVLSTEDRTSEIARMLGGVDITESTLRHAREMLEQAG